MKSIHFVRVVAVLLGALGWIAWTHAQTSVKVTGAWVRATVAQQQATGAFMQIQAEQGGRLLAASSPVAKLVEIHEMKMTGDVMQMRALPNGLELPAGKTVELKPGSYHIMLLELQRSIKAGDVVPLSLLIEGADKQRHTIEVKATAKAMQHGGHAH